MIELIWAMDENWLIGKDNALPWHYPGDTAYFWRVAKDKTVLMGRQTYLSLKTIFKDKPLPFKKMYVGTTRSGTYDDAVTVPSVKTFLENTKEDILVIGGAVIYALALPHADRLHVTYILKAYEGDTHFPRFDLSRFKLVSKRLEPELIFAVYERIKP
ncbi:MAG: dihydrofolate reductase [Acholeplasmataceae bacterium]|nr:MAG: dihydrofolate reductase [Acholeplasmataceae bacterium]